MSTLRSTFATVAIMAFAVACGPADATRAGGADSTLGDLDGRTFVSTDIVDGAERPLDSGATVTLSFGPDGVVSGSAGCNTLSGQAALTDGRLVVDGPLGGTEMACPDRQHHDQWLSDLLDSDPQVMLDGDRLTLTSGGTVVEMLDEQAANPDQPLVGPLWVLESIEQGTGPDATASSVPGGVTSTLKFRDDGTLAAALGCNGGGADYTVEGDTLVVEPIVHTQMACGEPAMEVESAVLEVVDGDVRHAIEGDQLRLTHGDRTLVYRAGDRPAE